VYSIGVVYIDYKKTILVILAMALLSGCSFVINRTIIIDVDAAVAVKI